MSASSKRSSWQEKSLKTIVRNFLYAIARFSPWPARRCDYRPEMVGADENFALSATIFFAVCKRCNLSLKTQACSRLGWILGAPPTSPVLTSR
jgi:hypothetical protein